MVRAWAQEALLEAGVENEALFEAGVTNEALLEAGVEQIEHHFERVEAQEAQREALLESGVMELGAQTKRHCADWHEFGGMHPIPLIGFCVAIGPPMSWGHPWPKPCEFIWFGDIHGPSTQTS